METVTLLFCWNIAISAFLAIAVAGLSWTSYLKRRPALSHSLWLLVLVKIITPPVIPLPILNNVPPHHEASLATPLAEATIGTSPTVLPEASDSALPATEVNVDPKPPVEEVNHQLSNAFSLVTVPRFLGPCWLVGSGLLLGYYLLQTRRTSRVLRRAGDADERVRRIAQAAAEDMNVRNVGVRFVDAQLPPMIWVGWSESFIVCPQELAQQLSDRQVKQIVSHELAHYVRRDQWANAFAMLVTAVCWWHPFAWLARREMKKVQELCCDEFAIEHCGADRQSYLKTLFLTLEFIQDQRVDVPALASSFGDRQSVASRFAALASGELRHRNTWVTMLALMLLFVGLLCVPVDGQKTAGSDADTAKPPTEPRTLANADSADDVKDTDTLFLHWFKPTYFGDDGPPEPLLTVKVTPSEEFDVLFTNTRTPAREHWIKGNIQPKNGQFFGRVESYWKSPEEFEGELKLDQPVDASGFLWVNEYFPTRVVLTHQSTAERFLKPEPEMKTEDPFQANSTPVTVVAIKPSNYANELAMAAGNSLGNWLAFNVYPQSNPEEVSDRNRRLAKEAIAKMLSDDTQLITWNPKVDAEEDERVAIGQPHQVRFVLDLGDGNQWDETVSLKFFLKGPPKIRNFAYRDTLSPVRSFLNLEFSIPHPDGGRAGTISGGAMVRSAFYSRGVLRTAGSWAQRYELIKSEDMDFSSVAESSDAEG